MPLKWVERVCSFKKDNLETRLSLNLELGPYSIRNLYLHYIKRSYDIYVCIYLNLGTQFI